VRRKALCVVIARQLVQQDVQRLPALPIERGEKLLLDPLGDRANALKLLLALRRELDDVAPPVLRIAPALDQPTLLESIEHPHELAAVEAQRVGNRSLGLADALGEKGEHRVVVRVESGLLEVGNHPRLDRVAEPPEKKGRVRDELPWEAGLPLRQLLRDLDGFDGRGFDGHGNNCSTLSFESDIVDRFNDWGKHRMSEQTTDRRWLAIAVLVSAQFMVVLDVAIVNVALPSIRDDLGFSDESLQWVVTAYAILFGGALLLGGRMADILGRRRLFAAGLALFTVSSLLDGLAWSEASLIGFRALQGLGAALLAPAALSILMTLFAEGRERNIALGIWGAASGSGGAAGVLLGGALTSAFNWSWIFYINVPVGVAVLAVTPFLIRESRADIAHRHFDVAGATSITGGLMLLVYAMTRATQHGWTTAETILLLAAAVALVGAFVVIELRSKAPLLPMRIFKLRTLTGSNVAGFLLASALFSQFFLLTLYMQNVLGYSAIETGVAYIALTLAIISFSAVSQAIATRFGIRTVMTVGLAVAAGAIVVYGRLPVDGHYFFDLFPAFVIGGIGMALAFVPMTIGALAGVQHSDAGIASGLINTSQQIGGAIGVAVASTIAATFTNRYVDAHPGTNAFTGPAETYGFHAAFYVLAGIAVAAAVLSALIVESRPPAQATEEVEEAAVPEAVAA
jgi:EmrB/QacA subfamily drug resistance transporter